MPENVFDYMHLYVQHKECVHMRFVFSYPAWWSDKVKEMFSDS